MPFAFPSFLGRLARPFTASTSLSVAAPGPGTAGRTTATVPPGAELATIAAGCFWGVEHVYRKNFSPQAGLLDARVGYTGGDTADPHYRLVCTDTTGHAESLQLVFDPTKLSYRTLIEFFYRIHDPTTANRQGMDVGEHYRSAIFTHSDEQDHIARDVTQKANKQWYEGKITTEVVKAGAWWDAEDYHQLYLDKNPTGYHCPTHFVRKLPDLA